jgi:hypothetical protein
MISRMSIGRGVTAGAIGVLSLAVGGIGVATAANGGSFTLGHTNTATKTTTLKDKKGTPLSLVGKKSKPPLKVNSSKQVAHLNASLLGGLSATKLATTGSGAQIPLTTTLNGGTPLGTELAPSLIASTATLKPGTYYLFSTTSGGNFCFISPDSATADAVQFTGSQGGIYDSEALSAVVTLTSPKKLSEYCYTYDPAPGSVYYDGGIFAIKVAHPTAGTASTATRRATTDGRGPAGPVRR